MFLVIYAVTALLTSDHWIHSSLSAFPFQVGRNAATTMGILCRDHHEPHINADELIVRDSSGGNLLIKVDLISSDITLNGSKPSAGKWYVCMDLDGNVAVGYDLSDQDRANLPIECNVLQLYGKQLTFPLLISTQLKNSAKRASAVFERCSQLRQVLFAPDGIPFLVTDDMDRLGFDVLLDYCGVHPLTAHQLPSSEVPINPSLYLTAEDLQHARTDGVAMMDDATRINHKSYCKIRRVSGSATLSPLDTLHPHKILINGTNSSILCLEDFFMHIHSLTSEYLSDSHRCDYAKPDRIRYVLPDVSLMSAAHSRVSLSRLSSDHSKTVATELGTIKDVINAFANLLDGTVSTLYIDNRLNSLTGSEDVRKIGNCTSPNVDSSAADIYFDIDNDILPGPFVLPITTQMRLYVFLFVTSLEEQIWAEELVQSWKIMLDKDNSPNMFCCSSAYLNYIIAVMPAADASSRPSVYGMTSNEPSYRAVLVYLEQWLVEFGTAYDAVICLSGTNAISRFSPPGQHILSYLSV